MRVKTFPREFYIPKGAVKVSSKKSTAVVYLSQNSIGRPTAIGFYGKADKPMFNYSFKDTTRRATYVAEWMVAMDQRCAQKEKSKADKKATMSQPQKFLKIGDVLRSSWGYDQTNIDYYEVVELVGKRGVMLREIAQETTETGFMSGKCVPLKGKYISVPVRKIVNETGSVKVRSFAWATKVEPIKDKNGIELGYGASNWTAYA